MDIETKMKSTKKVSKNTKTKRSNIDVVRTICHNIGYDIVSSRLFAKIQERQFFDIPTFLKKSFDDYDKLDYSSICSVYHLWVAQKFVTYDYEKTRDKYIEFCDAFVAASGYEDRAWENYIPGVRNLFSLCR